MWVALQVDCRRFLVTACLWKDYKENRQLLSMYKNYLKVNDHSSGDRFPQLALCSHVLGYHLATAHWMVSHAVIGQSIPRLIQTSSSPVISVNIQHKIINLGMLRSIAIKTQNESLDGLLTSEPLLSGIQARDQVLQGSVAVKLTCIERSLL